MSTRQKRIVIVVVVLIALIAVGAAVAYWTTTGGGSGTGTVGTTTENVVLTAAFDPGIAPGGTREVTFTAENPNTSDTVVNTIHLASVTTSDAECLPADFSMEDVTSGQTVAGQATVGLTAKGTLMFANTGVNQDPCKGATITLNVTST